MKDVNEWDEITIRTPGWKAKPDQVADFLRAVFPEDVILPYQQRVAEAGMREAVRGLRDAFRHAVKQRGDVPQDVILLSETVLNMLDPDHKDFDGYYPSRLVCPHHDTGRKPPHRAMKPVMEPCPGYPQCKAGMEIRETRR
jgi:hypothetical protein